MSDGHFTTVIAVVGRPNAGKSTLINSLLGQKIVATSRRPQTTRHRINAIHTKDNYQFIFTDTPGINQNSRTAFLRELNKTACVVLSDSDLILLMLDGLMWSTVEDAILKQMTRENIPCLAIINKIDRYRQNRLDILEFMKDVEQKYSFSEIIPLSSRKLSDVNYLEKILRKYAIKREFMFPADQVTDQSMRFYTSELIRERILRRFNKEIPYSAAIVIDRYEELPGETHIKATIHVEHESHKHIIIGSRGHNIREIGKQVREMLCKETNTHVDIRLWVKVSRSWSTNPKLLREFGYDS